MNSSVSSSVTLVVLPLSPTADQLSFSVKNSGATVIKTTWFAAAVPNTAEL